MWFGFDSRLPDKIMAHLERTRFKDDIVAEFLIPGDGTGPLIIFLDGMPAMPSKGRLARALVKKGYSIIHPRYRGTWESEGTFLEHSPTEDVIDVLDELPKGLKSAWSGEVFHVKPSQIIISCASFGGPAGLLASSDPRVSKVLAFSPVVDWKIESPGEPFEHFATFIKEGFGNGYRMSEDGLYKLPKGNFYNPINHVNEIKGEKIFIVHALDDDITLPEPIIAFAERTNSKILTLKKGGHFGASKLYEWRMWWRVKRFLKK